MSIRNKGRVVTGLWTVLALSLFSSNALGQADRNPIKDFIVGHSRLHPGGVAPERPAASCSVQPNEVIVGEPVTATVAASNFNPKHTLTYVWNPSSGGGKVIGNDAIAQIETTNAAPGNYIVTAFVSDAREKEKKDNEVSCSANFIIKPQPKNPPTLSVSASPVSVPVGGIVNLSAACTSPDGVPVTVANWTASAGTVSAAGVATTLNTAGASPGSIKVSATCTDSRGLTRQASTEMLVENLPPPPPKPEIELQETRLTLHSIYFPTTMPQIENPDAGLVASQQQTLVSLAADFRKYLESNPQAHLILEGHADPRGEAGYNQELSERRVERVKRFLVEQGVSEASIDTKAFGALHSLSQAEVKDAVENNTQLSPEERRRTLRDMRTIVLASDRRVDITLNTTGQSSLRQFPSNAGDASILIGNREGEANKKAPESLLKKTAIKH